MMTDPDLFYPKNLSEWRQWLMENHASKQAVWLLYYKKKSAMPSISWSEAVDEALCFGWIDSKAKPIDAEKYMQFFSRRKPKSVWSAINKKKIVQLIAEGRMTRAGLACIEVAKENGSWTILDDVEALIVPSDLEAAFEMKPVAKSFFSRLSRSDQRNMLTWLVLAKREETRLKRINEIVELAVEGLKPKQFR